MMANLSAPTAIWKIVFALAVMVMTSSGDQATCPSGARVYSLTMWHGNWLDSIDVKCTGAEQEQLEVPDDYSDWTNDDVGGEADEDVCANTAGVKSIEWSQVAIPGLVSFGDAPLAVAGVNVTCMDGEEYRFADPSNSISDEYAQLSECPDQDQYVSGISYNVDYRANYSSTDIAPGFKYLLTSIGVVCSSATQDSICWASLCSDGTSIKEDEPEFCAQVSCSEEECCEATDSTADDILVGVLSGAVVAALGAVTAWGYKRFVRKKPDKSNENTNLTETRATPTQP